MKQFAKFVVDLGEENIIICVNVYFVLNMNTIIQSIRMETNKTFLLLSREIRNISFFHYTKKWQLNKISYISITKCVFFVSFSLFVHLFPFSTLYGPLIWKTAKGYKAKKRQRVTERDMPALQFQFI